MEQVVESPVEEEENKGGAGCREPCGGGEEGWSRL